MNHKPKNSPAQGQAEARRAVGLPPPKPVRQRAPVRDPPPVFLNECPACGTCNPYVKGAARSLICCGCGGELR